MLTRIQRWGNSQGIRFSKALLQEARIGIGDEVNVSSQKGRIVVEAMPKARGKYDLNELVSRMPEDYRVEEVDWGTPNGKEIW